MTRGSPDGRYKFYHYLELSRAEMGPLRSKDIVSSNYSDLILTFSDWVGYGQ